MKFVAKYILPLILLPTISGCSKSKAQVFSSNNYVTYTFSARPAIPTILIHLISGVSTGSAAGQRWAAKPLCINLPLITTVLSGWACGRCLISTYYIKAIAASSPRGVAVLFICSLNIAVQRSISPLSLLRVWNSGYSKPITYVLALGTTTSQMANNMRRSLMPYGTALALALHGTTALLIINGNSKLYGLCHRIFNFYSLNLA